MFLDANGNPHEFTEVLRGGLSVGVPELLKILKRAYGKHGKLPFSDLFQPTIDRPKGFIMDKRLQDLVGSVEILNILYFEAFFNENSN